MGLLNNFLSFTLFSLFIHSTYALYFHIGETERKCFIEEIPDETTVLGKLYLFNPCVLNSCSICFQYGHQCPLNHGFLDLLAVGPNLCFLFLLGRFHHKPLLEF